MKSDSALKLTLASKGWEKIGSYPHHGIAVPLFSIHSQSSYGIGEYPDLILLIDWCVACGFDVIQLLPLNDTGSDNSPYSAISAFALNPIHIGLKQLPFVNEYFQLREALNGMPHYSHSQYVHYASIKQHKEDFLKIYNNMVGHKLRQSNDFAHFMKETAFWLKGYAAYKILKERYHAKSFELWNDSDRNPTENSIDALLNDERDAFDLICLTQFLCDRQLQKAKTIALEKKVFLMGDIPILIARDSVDVWQHRKLFDLEYSAGAPPDPLGKDGQNWGFPIYHWDALIDQNYGWWIERLNNARRYYSIYRIDHIVGLFRLWSIPIEKTSQEGLFIPEDESLWIDSGQKILSAFLSQCDMLPIGEDLGTIPPDVRKCMRALGICGTKVMRWERNWQGDQSFILPQEYSIDSMTTVSTHDTETLTQWWANEPDEAKRYAQEKGWSYHPILSREHIREILWDSHHTPSLFHINPIQEYFALLPGFSWENPEDERINVPGIISEKNWSYRLRPSLEELLGQNSLIHLIKELIE